MKQNVTNCIFWTSFLFDSLLTKIDRTFCKILRLAYIAYIARMEELKFEEKSVLKKLKENKRVQISYKEYSGNTKHK